MKIQNRELRLTRQELFEMIDRDNPDKSDFLKENILNIIRSYKNYSIKQYQWILSKIIFIVNHNNKYRNFRKKFKNFCIED
jgi:hypothetical protein